MLNLGTPRWLSFTKCPVVHRVDVHLTDAFLIHVHLEDAALKANTSIFGDVSHMMPLCLMFSMGQVFPRRDVLLVQYDHLFYVPVAPLLVR